MPNLLRTLGLTISVTLIATSPAELFARPKNLKARLDPSIPIVSAATQICNAGAGLRAQVLNIATKGRAQANTLGLQFIEVGNSLTNVGQSIAEIPSVVPDVINKFTSCVDQSSQLGALKRMPEDLDRVALEAKKKVKGAWNSAYGLGGQIKSAATQCGSLIEGRTKSAPGVFTDCLLGPSGMNINQTISDANALGATFVNLGPQINNQMNATSLKIGEGFLQCEKDGGDSLDQMFEGFTEGMNVAFYNFNKCSNAVLMDLNPLDKLENAMSDLEDLAGDAAMTPRALQEALTICIDQAANDIWSAVNPEEKLINLGEQLRKLGEVLMSALEKSFGEIEQLFPDVAKLNDMEKRLKKSCDAFKKQQK